MSGTPWNSIAESIPAGRAESPLLLADALESPCATCSTAPCCTHLPLTTFQVTNLVELDHAIYLLNFDRIELGLSATGEWSAYYTLPCRFLDRDSASCTVHGTSEQPRICVHYNPYNCWYKRAFTTHDSQEFVRLDRARLDLLLGGIVFDDDRRIVGVPAWEDIVALMASHEDQPAQAPAEPSLTDPMIEAWRTTSAGPVETEPVIEARTFADFGDPCTDCAAYCCSTLVFPMSVPTQLSNFDYYRFCLGFPGIELLVADGSWSLAVRTTCRHLDAGRCAIYGQPERPLICKYYDAHKCDYRPQFGVPRPDQSMRIRLEQYAPLVSQLPFDDQGRLLVMPSVEDLRATVEASWTEPVMLPLLPTRTVPVAGG